MMTVQKMKLDVSHKKHQCVNMDLNVQKDGIIPVFNKSIVNSLNILYTRLVITKPLK